MEKFELQHVVWPVNGLSIPSDLYYRATPNRAWQLSTTGIVYRQNLLGHSAHIEFSTFYGAFSLTTWANAASLDEIIIDYAYAGSATVNIWYQNDVEPRLLLSTTTLSKDDTQASIIIKELKGKKGILYPEIIPLEADFSLANLTYSTFTPASHAINLAVVMPTFKRESYVKKNAQLINATAHDNRQIKLYVIDNGQTLNPQEFADCWVIQNKNYGGAGGFARGVIEALNSDSDYTHILFCDDDVLIEPEAIKRLHSLLRYLPNDAIVPGGMLDMSHRVRLHEIGAVVHGLEFTGTKAGLDLTSVNAVIQYAIPEYSTFYGWWFVCYPVAAFASGLPFPAFVGFDDVEFGFRQQGADKVVVLPGISVWHEEFHKKEVNWRWYYHARNGLITHYQYGQGYAVFVQLFKQILGALLTYRYEKAGFLLQGAKDAMKGPEYLASLRADEFHLNLSKTQQYVMKPVNGTMLRTASYFRDIAPSKLRKFLVLLSLNGHLLPNFLMLNDDNPSKPGYAIEPLHANRLQAIFRKPTVLYYEPSLMQGIVCKMDKQRFFAGLTELFNLSLALLSTHKTMVAAWQNAHTFLTSKAFWQKHLELH